MFLLYADKFYPHFLISDNLYIAFANVIYFNLALLLIIYLCVQVNIYIYIYMSNLLIMIIIAI